MTFENLNNCSPLARLRIIFICGLILQCGFSSAQEIVWQNSIGGLYGDQLLSIFPSKDGGYICGGYSLSNSSGDKIENSIGVSDYWIIKLDAQGQIQWQNTIGGSSTDVLHSICQTADGGFLCGGNSYSGISGDKTENGIGYEDYWIVKLDSLGNIQWQNTIGGDSNDVLNSIAITPDGGSICGGYSASGITGDKSEVNHGSYDYWIIKLDSLGNIQWQNTIGGSGSDLLNSISCTSDSGYICGGTSQSGISGDKTENNIGLQDYWIVKLDAAGNIQWENTVGGNNIDVLYSIEPTIDNGFICAGYSVSDNSGDKIENSVGYSDYWVVKLDSLGNIQWQNTIGGSSHEQLNSIAVFKDGGYICGGSSYSYISGDKSENNHGVDDDFWVVRLDSIGNIVWENTIGGGLSDRLNAVAINSDGDIICAGNSVSSISGDKTENSWGDYDYWVVKITENFNQITGRLFADLNSNTVFDTGEPVLITKKITEVNSGRFDFTDQNGYYFISVLDSGSYNVVPDTIPYYISVPGFQSIYFSGIHQHDSLNDFAIQPTGAINDLSIHLSVLNPFRSGFNTSIMITYENLGTTTLNGNITFYPDSNMAFLNSTLIPITLTQDSIVWSIGTLLPFQTGNILLTFHINTGLPIGSVISSSAIIDPVVGDFNPPNNSSMYSLLTIGSLDPNNIKVNTKSLTIAQLNTGPFLDYIINFQNTGNDTAFKVTILNPIDTIRLDLKTIEFVSSSHPVNLNYINWENNMEFKFENIHLPDSNINEPMSHGFIRYRIKPKNTLLIGDLIRNYGAIYFDYNPPVLTNVAITKIIVPATYSVISVLNCDSYISPSGKYVWTASGIYTDSILNVDGGDSIMTINLTIINHSDSTIFRTKCNKFVSPSGNFTWTISGIYYDTIPNSFGCDSIITIDLTLNKSYSTINESACESYVSPSGNYTWTVSGIYQDTISNAVGCDSIITIDLIINDSFSAINQSACESYISPSGSYTWTASGIYSDTIQNMAGCDSVITINLSINKSQSTIYENVCESYTSPSGNYSWTASGTYFDTIPNASGCDSVITIDLIIDTVDVSVIANPPALFANTTGAVYQWIYCDSALIPGETNQGFTATSNGSYAVIITQNNCMDTSACYSINNVGLNENDLEKLLSVFPNPAKNTITVLYRQLSESAKLSIIDPLGRIVYQYLQEEIHATEFKNTIELSGFPGGLYFIHLETGKQMVRAKFVKL